ncbi:hypothetical protein [Erythrobacter sp. THAF29]|uniref:hypothetical protein n=1 Tax=Erythrobacter sp. THAF29 TaxID=2587851 RepID=UPI001562BE7E|nr:hypothetical protein [Erythrobacter sp. THAF29]
MGIPALALFSGSPLWARSGIQIPEGPMRLTRRLERGLKDGVSIVVNRTWRIDFAREERGASITGRQLSATVDAPKKLAALARIEETRPTDDMWPIHLSGDGRIVAAGKYTREEDFAAAVREAETMIAQRSYPAEVKERHRQYLAQLHNAAGSLLDDLPPDLFFPQSEQRETRRPVDLPGGLRGEFVMNFTARRAAGHPWLAEAERSIVTRIADDERHSSDRWTLAQT